jgi:site-specific recombinase XerD
MSSAHRYPRTDCREATSWSSTGAFGAPWRLRTRAPGPSEAYTDAVRLLATYCQAHGHPVFAGELQREHVQDFIADQLARWKPATAHNRYRGLHAFFKWAVAEGDLEASPMGGMRPPQLPEQPVEVVGPEHLARLLKACEGRDLPCRRDTAVILLLVDTGMAPGRVCWHDPG